MSISHAVQQALDYFSNSPEWFAKVNQTKKVAGFRLKGIHPLALILENQGITIFVQQGSWLSNPTLRILQRTDYQPEQTRNSNLKSCTPELYEGHAAACIKVPDLAALQELCRIYAR